MKIKVISSNPAIVEVEFDELENYDLSETFKKPSAKIDYGKLHVESQREVIEKDDYFLNLQENVLKPALNEVMLQILSLEYLRYPIKDDNTWLKPKLFKGLNCQKVIDKAGFFMPWHLDNRWIMMAGIINVQDNAMSTHFSKSEGLWLNNGKEIDESQIFHVAQSKKYTGTFWANTEQTWHCVPFCEQERKIILVDLHIH